jgi:curli biogenesis system outer membrane secretion channel CsgG
MTTMKKFRWHAALLPFFILLAACADAKPSIAVRAFDNKAGDDAEAPASAITDMMATELHDSGIFTLTEREKLDYIAEEIRLGQSGLVDPSTAPELGKIKGAQYTMTGAITLYFYNASAGAVYVPGILGAGAAGKTAYVTIDLRIIDNATGEVAYAAAEQGEAKREAAGLLTKFGGFASGSYGGILASAARDSVVKHADALKRKNWQ